VLVVRAGGGGGGAGPRAGAAGAGGGGGGSVGGMNFGTRSHLVCLPRSHPDIIAIKLEFYSTVLVSVTSIGFYCSPFRAYIAKCFKKVAQNTASFCSLPCRLG